MRWRIGDPNLAKPEISAKPILRYLPNKLALLF